MTGHILKLFCFIISDTSSFPVNIRSSETVGDLKNEIKKETTPQLDLIPAHHLTLWAVNLADDADLASNAQKEITGNALSPLKKLSKVFPSPDSEEEKVHIVVMIPDNGAGECSPACPILHSFIALYLFHFVAFYLNQIILSDIHIFYHPMIIVLELDSFFQI
ncbi:hypothetical protein K439DRAFT_1612619 [Ramaria rubella]|nr:hypothetical protein K439DRAFT_1612619 [Ramaria rubella]